MTCPQASAGEDRAKILPGHVDSRPPASAHLEISNRQPPAKFWLKTLCFNVCQISIREHHKIKTRVLLSLRSVEVWWPTFPHLGGGCCTAGLGPLRSQIPPVPYSSPARLLSPILMLTSQLQPSAGRTACESPPATPRLSQASHGAAHLRPVGLLPDSSRWEAKC